MEHNLTEVNEALKRLAERYNFAHVDMRLLPVVIRERHKELIDAKAYYAQERWQEVPAEVRNHFRAVLARAKDKARRKEKRWS